MRSIFPRTVGAISGWMMTAFLAGIALHSLFWQRHIVTSVWIVCFVMCILLIYAAEPRPLKIVCLIVFAFLLGTWRFDIAPRPPLRWINGHAWVVASEAPSSGALSILPRWRHFLTARILQVFPRDDAMLMVGMLYGDETFSKEQRSAFAAAGLMHLVAVSGSNVTIVVGVLFACAQVLQMRRRHIFWFCSIGLLVFVGFVGASASVSRAALMGWLVLVARELGRISSPSRLLGVSACVLVGISPWQLFFDMSFALSFLSMWGVLSWMPIFFRWFSYIPERGGLREALAMTSGAMLATSPYLLWVFGQISLAGIVTNVLVFPLVPFAMAFFAAAAAWGALPLSFLVHLPALGLSRLIYGVARLALQYPWMQMRFAHASGWFLIALYIFLVYFESQLRKKNDLSTRRSDMF